MRPLVGEVVAEEVAGIFEAGATWADLWKTGEVDAVEGAVMEASDEELMVASVIEVDFWEAGEEGAVEGAVMGAS